MWTLYKGLPVSSSHVLFAGTVAIRGVSGCAWGLGCMNWAGSWAAQPLNSLGPAAQLLSHTLMWPSMHVLAPKFQTLLYASNTHETNHFPELQAGGEVLLRVPVLHSQHLCCALPSPGRLPWGAAPAQGQMEGGPSHTSLLDAGTQCLLEQEEAQLHRSFFLSFQFHGISIICCCLEQLTTP